MDIDQWKLLADEERRMILQNYESFDPYTDGVYALVRALGRELAEESNLDPKKVGVPNRFGELIIHLHEPDSIESKLLRSQISTYYGFRVFYSSERAWFEH